MTQRVCCSCVVHLVQHLQREAAVAGQPLVLLGGLQAQLAGLVLQSRHLLLQEEGEQSVQSGAPEAQRGHEREEKGSHCCADDLRTGDKKVVRR